MSERIESAEIEAAVAQGGTIEIVFVSAKDGKQIEGFASPPKSSNGAGNGAG